MLKKKNLQIALKQMPLETLAQMELVPLLPLVPPVLVKLHLPISENLENEKI
jgi:hypothetical protein